MGDCVNRPNDIASRLLNYERKRCIKFFLSRNRNFAQYATLREYLIPT